MYEAIEVTMSREYCNELGITEVLEPELQLAVTARLEEKLDVEDVTIGFSGWNGVGVWDADGDKIEPRGALIKIVQTAIAREARKLTA
jgi:hypothetical protein